MAAFFRNRLLDEHDSLIIGPSGSGKTGFLGAISHAADQSQDDPYQPAVRLVHTNEAMSALAEQVRLTIQTGKLPIAATLGFKDYRFTLEVRNTTFSSTVLEGDYHRARFTVVDGPGGTLEQAGGDNVREGEFANHVYERLSNCHTLIVCLDSCEPSRAVPFTKVLNRIIAAIRGRAALRHLLFVLTKAELFCVQKRLTMQRLQGFSPWDQLWELLGEKTIYNIWRLVPPGRITIGCLWASSYGFVGDKPNFDARTETMRIFGDHESAKKWRPFQILDALVCSAGGPNNSLWIWRT